MQLTHLPECLTEVACPNTLLCVFQAPIKDIVNKGTGIVLGGPFALLIADMDLSYVPGQIRPSGKVSPHIRKSMTHSQYPVLRVVRSYKGIAHPRGQTEGHQVDMLV